MFFFLAFPCITDEWLSVNQPMGPNESLVLDAAVVSEAKRYYNPSNLHRDRATLYCNCLSDKGICLMTMLLSKILIQIALDLLLLLYQGDSWW